MHREPSINLRSPKSNRSLAAGCVRFQNLSWQFHRHHQTPPISAIFRPNVTAVQARDATTDREAEPVPAAVGPAVRTRQPDETFEYALQLVGGQTGAFIPHLNPPPIPRAE